MLFKLSDIGSSFENFSKTDKGLEYFFKGYVVWGGEIFMDTDFVPIIEEFFFSDKLAENIPKFNGNFIGVVKHGNSIILFNDRYGIYPMFIYKDIEKIAYSNQWKLLVQYAGKELRQDSILETLAFGNVLGEKTLIKGIEELPPATIQIIDLKTRQIDSQNYWKLSFSFNNRPYRGLEKLFSELWSSVMLPYTQFLSRNGNSCVQLLSGGLDSRILAHEFNDAGIDLYAITYGNRLNSNEILAAKKVVDKLSSSKYHKTFSVGEAELKKIVSSSIEVDRITQARNAEKELMCYDELRDKVFYRAPGYSGDFTMGSHIKYKMRYWSNQDDILNYLYKFKVSPLIKKDLQENSEHWEMLRNSILESLEKNINPISSFLDWDLKYRQRRYIVRPEIENNSGKTNLLLPFFDYRLMDFASELPMKALLNTHLYVNAQLRYVYSNNKELMKIKRDNTAKIKRIRNNFFYEYNKKLESYLKKFKKTNSSVLKSNWASDIDWKYHLNSWMIDEIEDQYILKIDGVSKAHLIYLLSLYKLKQELKNI